MATFTSAASGNWNATGQTTWNEVGYPVAGDTVTIQAGHVVTLVQDEACASLTIDATGELDMDVYALANSGSTVVNGTLTIGISAGAGLSTHGWIVNSGATVNMQTESVINLYPGTVDIHPSATWALAPAGSYIIHSGTIDWDGLAYVQRPYKFSQNDGSVINLSKNAYFGNGGMHSNILNGVINVGSYILHIGAKNVFTIGANCDLTGTGDVRFRIDAGATITWNCTTSFSHTGKMQFVGRASPGNVIPAADFSNSNITILQYSGTLPRKIVISDVQCGGLCCKSFLLEAASSSVVKELIIDNSANCDINISGDLDWTDAVATYDVTYIAGTGTMTFTGSSGTQTINFNDQTVEDIIIDAAGAIKQLTGAASNNNFTIKAGTFDQNAQSINNFTVDGAGNSIALANDISANTVTLSAGSFDTLANNITTTSNMTLHPECEIVGASLNGSTWTVGGNFLSSGIEANHIELKGTATWYLTVTGTCNADYTDAAYSDASGGTAVTATGIDFGNNINWDYVAMRPGLSAAQGHYAIALMAMDEGI